MPELPEVETLRQELENSVKGKIFTDVFCDSLKLLNKKLPEFKKSLKGRKILDILRRGKMLAIKLDSDLFLLIHLKMSGQLIYKLPAKTYQLKPIYGGHPQPGGLDNLPNKFTHIYFTFSDGSVLYFNDMRKFGWAKLVKKPEQEKIFNEYGIEALSSDFTLELFKNILKRRLNKKIKPVLMEQNLIAGIGNIYADESLFCAGILPARAVKTLKNKEIEKLLNCIPKILKLAILKKGTSADLYVQLNGKPGGMVPYLNVYGREGEKCKKCGTTIKKIKLGGRGTHFCPKCQK